MTDLQLRDLLEERVADVSMRDLAGVAWRDGRAARRRDRIVALGATAAVVLVVSAGVVVLGGSDPTQPSPAPGVPTPTPAVDGRPDATYEGVPVWWSLGQEQEGNLPFVEGAPLPHVVDLEAGPLVKDLDRAVAAFAVGDGVRLVDERGGQVGLSLSRLDDVVKPNGYGYRPVHHSMLSPTGEYLVFPQNGSVAVYALDGGWSTIDTGDARTLDVRWFDATTIVLPRNGSASPGPLWTVDGEPAGEGSVPRADPGFDTMTAQAFGPTATGPGAQAQAWGMGVPIPVADAGTYLSEPEFISATVSGERAVLAIMWDLRDEGHGGRFLQCCPVAGWLDDQTLVYESRQTAPSLVAWTVGTHDFGLVSTIEGSYLLASFADLS